MNLRAAALALLVAACQGGKQPGGDAGNGTPDSAVAPDAPGPPADAVVADADTRPLPDLTIGGDRLRVDLSVDVKDFATDACELDPQEDCIGGPGARTLLRFAVETPNIGNADLLLGTPSDSNENFVYSACHDHYHYEGYAGFALVDGSETVAAGHKQAFCLLDSERYIDDPSVATDGMYWCGYQGIQRGWSDVYHTRLGCQFIDVTGVAPGSYLLRVVLNQAETLEELSYDNNQIEVPVTVGDPDLLTPTEDCPADLEARVTRGSHRECGWTLQQTFDCTPGRELRVGCSTCNGIGSCTGDPMIRVCDPAHPGGNCTEPGALGYNDDSCSECPRVKDIDCPASGQVAVYVGAAELGQDYGCNLEIREL